ncbi:teichoic acid biosynthesis protein B [Ectopseudomonas alcaliphila JAB1]|nr:CDP-glycerol glycerophosphotransferase family protein [Pseudomonas alcaliphila]APU30962.1 teichoic acid biosynthesis protein B [Pseudomonas alcaliphila JAB1]
MSRWAAPIRHKRLAVWLILPLWWLYDRLTAKRANHWAFFVHPLKPSQFVENSRAMFEAVKGDPRIYKRVFTRDLAADLRLDDACNTEVIDVQSLRGLYELARCGVYLLTNAVALDMSWRWADGSFSVVRPSLTRRVVVNLWHGIPLKRLFALANSEQRQRADRVAFRRRERRHYAGLIASSDVDSYAMTATFHPLPPERVWITGLPRNDFLRMDDEALPRFLHDEVELIRSLKGARRLLVYAPTFREDAFAGAECYQFSDKQVIRLKALLRQHNAVLGFRMHYFRKGERLFNLEQHLDGETLIDLGHVVISEIAAVLREADLLLTDYSSVYIDALYLNKPVVSFAYDLEHYCSRQNGLLYDMDMAFPGPVVTDFDNLLQALDQELADGGQVANERYHLCRKLFFNHLDDGNAQRVLDKLRELGAYEE